MDNDNNVVVTSARKILDGNNLIDVRGGCVGFGQRRNYSVTSYGTADANL